MSDARIDGRSRRGAAFWLALLGACTLWLVVQNTLLFVALVWAEPAGLMAVTQAVFKAGGVVVSRLWPVATVATLASIPFVLMLRAALQFGGGEEVRHG